MVSEIAPSRRVDERRRIHFAWLIRLRWAAIAGQLITIVTAYAVMGLALPLAPLLAVIGVEVVVNVVCAVWVRAAADVP